MYRVRNSYKECHIMDLNLMDVAHYKRSKFSRGEIVTLLIPLAIFAFTLGFALLPEMSFFAECQNIPGGDICHISWK